MTAARQLPDGLSVAEVSIEAFCPRKSGTRRLLDLVMAGGIVRIYYGKPGGIRYVAYLIPAAEQVPDPSSLPSELPGIRRLAALRGPQRRPYSVHPAAVQARRWRALKRKEGSNA